MKYNIFYKNIPNMGDLLNKVMLESLFDIKVNLSNINHCNLIAIGSGLKNTFCYGDTIHKLRQKAWNYFKPNPLYVWGTGFMNYREGENAQFRFRNMKFLALRGNLTKQKVEKILGKEIDVTLGDGGLLAERWIGNNIIKKYSVGIIPHFREQDSPLLGGLRNAYSDSIIINLRNDPTEVVKQIASCEVIMSSSLHGLIVSDSFHIPNVHIKLYDYGERMYGDGYKFEDYYSSFSKKDEPILISEKKRWPKVTDIKEMYQIEESLVEQKKDALYRVFPK